MTRTARLRAILVAGAALAWASGGSIGARADVIKTGYLYISDYGQSELDRFMYTYDQTIDTTSFTPAGANGSTVFLGGGSNPVKEGVHGTSNDLIIVGGSHGSSSTVITRYDLNGNLIGTIPVNFSAYNNGSPGIGNVLVTPDGHYMYAPLEAGNAIVKIDLTNGAIVATHSFTGAHDVAIAQNGDVYVSNYAASGATVIRLDSNLTAPSAVTIIPAASGFRPSGLSVAADGSLYVENNKQGGPDSVLHYTISGSGTGVTATYDATHSYVGSSSQNALEFTFGNNIGPDGKVYIAALGGGGNGGFAVQNGYSDGIYQFDPSTLVMTEMILGFTEKTGPAASDGFYAPKYLQFDTNFVTAPDAGYNVPEPGTLGVMLVGIAALAGLPRLRRRCAT